MQVGYLETTGASAHGSKTRREIKRTKEGSNTSSDSCIGDVKVVHTSGGDDVDVEDPKGCEEEDLKDRVEGYEDSAI